VFRLKLLGGASLTGPSGPLSGRVVQRRQMALLALLGGARSSPLTREKVAALLWPESPAKQARSSLSDALHVLHKALGDGAVEHSGDDLRLNPDVVWCDVQAFREALREGRPEGALEPYAGPFLDGFHFSGSPEFERWLDGERDALRREAREAADGLAMQREAAGDLAGAVMAARRALALEPHDEAAARQLMRLLASAGDRAAAVAAYESFAKGLRTDLELAPSPETVELADGIRAGNVTPSLPMPGDIPEQPSPSTSPPPVPEGWITTPVQPPTGFSESTQPHTPGPTHRGPLSPAASPAGPAIPQPAASGPAQRHWQRPGLAALVILAVVSGGLWLLKSRDSVTVPSSNAEHDLPSVAVLPFDNRSPDPAHAYFAGALHDELLTQLSRVRGLRVISRTSVMEYAAAPRSVRDIAGELGVASVVEGSVQVLGDRLRVNVQLIDAGTDGHLWAERYDRTLGDAFAIQSDLAHQVVAAVGATLTGVEAASIARAPTENPEAYLLYLQGLEYMRRPGRTHQNWEIAQSFYEQAVALDSTFALAWAALAETHGTTFWLRYDPSPSRLVWLRGAAETAVRFAPDLPQAHQALGTMHYRAHRDWESALGEYQIALEGLPNDSRLVELVGAVHRRLGNWTEVLEAFRQIMALDPRNVNVMRDLGGNTFRFLRRYPEALEWYDRALALAPELAEAHMQRGWTWIVWHGSLDSLAAALDRVPSNAERGPYGSSDAWQALRLHWQRQPDSLLALLRRTPERVFEAQESHLPRSLYFGWAHQLKEDTSAARAAFDSACIHLDSVLVVLPHDWTVHAARGLALAGLGRSEEAREEAAWLEESPIYREDAYSWAGLAELRAMILAGIGDADPALVEIERLLAGPSPLSVHTLRLDPRWDPIREHPRFKALLARYAEGGQ
jgi:TolB-like protein/DNA-binding SARP family transcriptional activator